MVAVFSLLPTAKTRKNHLAWSMSIGQRHFHRRRLPVVHFYRRKLSAIFTEGYVNAVFEIFPEVNNRLRSERTPNLHKRITRLKAARTLDSLSGRPLAGAKKLHSFNGRFNILVPTTVRTVIGSRVRQADARRGHKDHVANLRSRNSSRSADLVESLKGLSIGTSVPMATPLSN
jgi:hypothetical protein